jgi:RNA polymerase sigma-70 factor (ECF subfamily)
MSSTKCLRRDVRRPAGGKRPADFERIVLRELPRLFSRARAIVGSDDLAWDAIQETLVRVWARGFLPPEPGPALAHLVVRSSLHLLRCSRRRKAHEALAAQDHGPCCPEDPVAGLERDDDARVVRESLARLARAQREVFELFVLQGESYEDIADKLRIPVGTVRSRLHRARKELRAELERAFSLA